MVLSLGHPLRSGGLPIRRPRKRPLPEAVSPRPSGRADSPCRPISHDADGVCRWQASAGRQFDKAVYGRYKRDSDRALFVAKCLISKSAPETTALNSVSSEKTGLNKTGKTSAFVKTVKTVDRNLRFHGIPTLVATN